MKWTDFKCTQPDEFSPIHSIYLYNKFPCQYIEYVYFGDSNK